MPNTIELTDSLSLFPAAFIALFMSAVLGLLLYVSIFRPLRTASAVTKAVSSIAILVVITGLMVVRLGTRPINSQGSCPPTSG